MIQRLQDWTRRIGSERHLVGVEDPFDTSHDLGRTVDRRSCGFLRQEFERAARLLHQHQHPAGVLFEPDLPFAELQPPLK